MYSDYSYEEPRRSNAAAWIVTIIIIIIVLCAIGACNYSWGSSSEPVIVAVQEVQPAQYGSRMIDTTNDIKLSENKYNFTITEETEADEKIASRSFLPRRHTATESAKATNTQLSMIEYDELEPNRKNFTYLLDQQAPEEFYEKYHEQYKRRNM